MAKVGSISFSSYSSGFFGIEGPVCGQRWPFQDCTERPAAAVVGSNELNKAVHPGRTGLKS